MISTQRSASSVKSAGSAKSKNSDRSLGRYKKAGGGGADESLFGGQPAAVGSAAPSRKVEQMRKGPPSKVEYDSVVITAQDLARLRIVSDTSGALTTEQRERAAEMEVDEGMLDFVSIPPHMRPTRTTGYKLVTNPVGRPVPAEVQERAVPHEEHQAKPSPAAGPFGPSSKLEVEDRTSAPDEVHAMRATVRRQRQIGEALAWTCNASRPAARPSAIRPPCRCV